MEAVLSWVKQIFILSILSTVVTHLMPSAKYTKYASYICGLLIVIVYTAACGSFSRRHFTG